MNELAKKIHEIAVKHGFYENKREMGTLLMLCVSELSEALEADRKDHRATLDSFQCKQNFRNPDFLADFEVYVKDTFEDEIADTIIRLLDLCAYKGIDIEKHIELKMRYNAMRPYKHGKKY